MNSFQKNKLAFILAFLFLSSVSAEELLHEHHDDHDYIAAELDCNFCIEITPEFNTKNDTFGDQYFIIKNPIGVTSSTLTQDCLTKAMENWNGSVEVTPMPIVLGILIEKVQQR